MSLSNRTCTCIHSPTPTIDNGITHELGKLIANALQDPITFNAAKELIKELSLHDDVYNDLCILAAKVTGDSEAVKEAMGRLLTDSTMEVLADEKLRNCSQQFVVDVISDEAIHKVAGDAITDTILVTVQQAAWSSIVKGIGVSVITASVGLITIILSPY